MLMLKTKSCKHENCNKQPSYNFPGYSPEYCSEHAKKTNIRMIYHPLQHPKEEIKNCEYCSFEIHYNEQFCKGCKEYIKNNNKTTKRKNKELRIKELLDDYEIKYIHDKRIGESKFRPDFIITTKWGCIVIEVDENQHKRKNYPCECENLRMKSICEEIRYTNLLKNKEQKILFIRYNPDTYKFFDEHFSSQKREDFLIKMINEYNNCEPKYNASTIYLFYDHFTNDQLKYIGGVEPDKIE